MMHFRGFFDNGEWFYDKGDIYHHWAANGWGALIGLAVLIAAVVTVVILVKKRKKSSANSVVIEALKLKYAKGEITEDEYLKRKSVLLEK